MKKINLLNHQGLSFDAFKTWLNQLIADKKGALPDLNDWKLIKEKLDKVTVTKIEDTYVNDDDEYYTPWLSWENDEIDDEMDLEFIEEINYLMDLSATPSIEIRITYDKASKENDNNSNFNCEGI